MTKHLKRPVSILLCILMVAGLFTAVPFTAGAITDLDCLEYGDFYYRVLDNVTAQIAGYNAESEETDVVIPDTIDGHIVIGIEDEAFLYAYLDSLTIPYTVTDISIGAFGADSISEIRGYNGTAAETFCNQWSFLFGFTFVSLGDVPASHTHTYGEPEWTWADDYSSATATFICTDSRCNHEETVEAAVTSEAKDGIIIYTAVAELDGETYTDTKTAFADGIGARLIGHSVSLDGDIGINFYMELSDSVVADRDTAYMHFTIPNGSTTTEQDMLVKDAKTVESGGKTYYVFKCNVAAKEMTSEIKAQIIDGDRSGTEYTYSVKEYADYLLDHKNDNAAYEKAAPLVEKMLRYGAYAEAYFDDTNTLENLGGVTIDIADPVINNLPEGTTFEGASLSLKSETTLSLFFKSSETLTFSCDGYDVETVQSGDYQIARIRGIKAKHIGDILTLNINGGTVRYSPLNYCKNVLHSAVSTPDEAQAQDGKLVNVVKALYAYWQAADSYFD